jgi:hypothetical protein
MKPVLSFGVLAVLLVTATFLACSHKASNPFGDPDGGDDASVDRPLTDDEGGCGVTACSDGGDGGCVNLQCQASFCPQGKPETSLTGHVYDPAGNLPLYNVYVYIPNATPDPIDAGNPTCTQCQALPSGDPIIGALTDGTGAFNLQRSKGKWGVPSGDNIPLVIQLGKWRTQLVIPHIDACTTLDLDGIFNTGTGKARQLRLPGNGTEGDMPLMAFTSGCDPAECFLRHIGIDDSEFAPPGTAGKHVHFYTGRHYQPSGPPIPASSVDGGNTPADTYQWWTSSTNLLQYDIIFNACECQEYDRGAPAYGAMQSYLNGGGRLFATHFYYNWFAPPNGQFQQVADWYPGQAHRYFTGTSASPYFIDSSFPKGEALATWLLAYVGAPNVTGSVSSGVRIKLSDTNNDVNASGPPTYADSTRWIYNASSPGADGGPPALFSTMYLSFDTPTTVPDGGTQCGRAVFSDVHLSGYNNNRTFPDECQNPDPDGSHVAQEKALEFLFFDLSSCVRDGGPGPT